MANAKTHLEGNITIKGDFDVYLIDQDDYNRFITRSKNGYCNADTGGHRSLVAAIQHVNAMINTEYIDRCLDEPK